MHCGGRLRSCSMVSYMPWQARSFSREPSVCRSSTRATRKMILTPVTEETVGRWGLGPSLRLGGTPPHPASLRGEGTKAQQGNEPPGASGSWQGEQAPGWPQSRDQAHQAPWVSGSPAPLA